MLPTLIPLLNYFFGGEESENTKTIFHFLVEQFDEFLQIILDFYKPLFDVLLYSFEDAYSETFVTFTNFIMDLVNRQTADFSNNGRIFVNGVFSAINFENTDFTSNFLFWFVGLLIFAFCAKLFFSLTFGLLKTLLSALLGFKL